MEHEQMIKKLDLTAHIEGGYFKETYKSSVMVPTPDREGGERNASSSIIYMLTEKCPTDVFCMNKSDMVVYFQGGSAVTYYIVTEDGTLSVTKVGQNFSEGDKLQIVVPANTWKAAHLESGKYGIVGENLAPGFDYRDMKLADKKTLIEKFPQHSEIFEKFCKS